MPASFALRFALAFLYAVGDRRKDSFDREPYDEFWREATMRDDVGGSAAAFGRHQHMNAAFTGMARAAGIEPDVALLHRLRVARRQLGERTKKQRPNPKTRALGLVKMQGSELRAIRKSMGLTQGQLAKELGFSLGFIGEMERDEKVVERRTELAVRALVAQRASGANSHSVEPQPAVGGTGALSQAMKFEGYIAGISDPMEQLVERALQRAGVRYVTDRGGQVPANLDFYLPDFDVYLEVKRMHSDRIGAQMARAPNVIAIQGEGSVRFLVEMFARKEVSHG